MPLRDYYLRAESEAGMLAALRAAGLACLDEGGQERPMLASHVHALDVIGTIHRPGEYDSEGDELSPPVAKPGWHANLRWLGEGEPPATLLAIALDPEPETPERVWA